jgi:hypothetical protein
MVAFCRCSIDSAPAKDAVLRFETNSSTLNACRHKIRTLCKINNFFFLEINHFSESVQKAQQPKKYSLPTGYTYILMLHWP